MRLPRLLLATGLLGFLSAGSPEAPKPEADANPNSVAKKIDEIVKSPEYDWLREEETSPHPLESGQTGNIDGQSKSRFVQTDPQGGGCGYRMGPPVERKRARGKSCDNDTPGSCGNDSIGDCSFKPQGGSCGSFTIGSTPAGFGYLLGILLLAGILIFVVWSVKRAETLTERKTRDRAPRDLEPDKISLRQAAKIPANELLKTAGEAAERGDYKTAVGMTYLASLNILHENGRVNLSASTTNIEIVSAVQKNGGPHEAAGNIFRTFEEIYFGGRTPTVTHWETCRSLIEGHFAR